jgi:hypothetical protein
MLAPDLAAFARHAAVGFDLPSGNGNNEAIDIGHEKSP